MKIQYRLTLTCISCLLLLCGYFSPLFSQTYNAAIEADLELISKGEFYQVRGFANNKTEFNRSLRYVFTVFTKDTLTDDDSKEEKSGRIVLAANQKTELGTSSFALKDYERVILLLLIYDENDQIVGKDRVVLNDFNDETAFKERLLEEEVISQDMSEQGEDGISLLTGIVVENTLTKPGRDFYRQYVDDYIFNNIDGEKVIEIKELLALGSNTLIRVQSEDQVIFEFYVNPRADYLEQMVEMAIARTNNYFQNLRKNRNLIKKY